MELIYERPHDHDLEHEGDAADVAFHIALLQRLGAHRVLELGCGSRRIMPNDMRPLGPSSPALIMVGRAV